MDICLICSSSNSCIEHSCSKSYILCNQCIECITHCPFCNNNIIRQYLKFISNGPMTYDNRITLKRMSNRPVYQIQSIIYPYVQLLGMMPDIESEYKIHIDPINTIVETEESISMNLLQYSILMSDISDIKSRDYNTLDMFFRAYYSLVDGLERGVDDIASLYDTDKYDDEIQKRIIEKIYTNEILYYKSHNLSLDIKRAGKKGITKSMLEREYNHPIDNLLLFCIEREWIHHIENRYIHMIYLE